MYIFQRFFILALVVVSSYGSSSAQILKDFGALSWQEQDSVIATFYESGIYSVCFPMIDTAYATQKANESTQSTPLALFAMWKGIRYMLQDSNNLAIAYLGESYSICQEHQAARDSLYPDLLINLSELQFRMNLPVLSSKYLRQAAEYMSSTPDPQPELYLSTLNRVTSLESSYGSIDTAELYSKKALKFAQDSYGQTSTEYFEALAGIGQVYQMRGDWRRASRTILQAYQLAKDHLADNDLSRITLGRNAANIQENLGRTEDAEVIYQEILEFFDKNTNEQNGTLYPNILNQVGAFYLNLQDFDKAYEYYNRANILFTLRTDRTDPNYIISQSNVADLLKWKGQFVEAEQYYSDALQYAPQAFGEQSWLVGHLHESLGDLHFQSGAYNDALANQERARDIYRNTQGDLSPEYAQSLQSLGKTYEVLGNDSLAEINLSAAHDQYIAIYGQGSALVFNSSSSLAEFHAGREASKAKRYFLQSGTQLLENIYSQFEFLLDEERSDRLRLYKSFFKNFMDFQQMGGSDPSVDRMVHQIAIAFKSAQLRPNLTTIARLLKNPTNDFRSQYDQWQNIRSQVINEQNLTLEDRRSNDIDVEVLTDNAREIERQLLKGLARGKRFEEGALDRIQQSLDTDAAYIEFYKMDDVESGDQSSSANYYAYIMTRGSGVPAIVKLNPTALMGSGPIPSNESYAEIWVPLNDHLANITSVIICPDKVLNQFPFHLIRDVDGKLLLDRYDFRYVAPGGVIPFGEGIRVDGRKAMLVGGAIYDLNPAALTKNNSASAYNLSLSLVDAGLSSSRPSFGRLEFSIAEIHGTAAVLAKKKWETHLLEGADANEATVKKSLASERPALVHVNTHAFELVDSQATANHSLIRCGIALSGADYLWRGAEVAQEVEDGLLSGMEIASLDLSDADLVVLHLRGVGREETAMNVLKAFKAAGAKQVLTCLWDIDPNDANTFLNLFYKNLLKGSTPHEALTKTRAKLKKKMDQEGWGGFVLVE